MTDEERAIKKLDKENSLAIAYAELKYLREAWGTVTTIRVPNGSSIEKELLCGISCAALKVCKAADELSKL